MHWLGVSHCVGSHLCYWLITESGKIISKSSVEHVTQDDYLKEDIMSEIDTFDQRLKESLDDNNFIIDGDGELVSMYLDDIELDK